MSQKNDAASKAGNNTRLAHGGHDPQSFHGFVNPPVVHASTVLFPDVETAVSGKAKYTYGTHGTPTTDAVCQAFNELENAAGTLLYPSGLASITMPWLAVLSPGDHILITDSAYDPARRFADQYLKRMGIEVEYYHPDTGAEIEKLFRPNTRLLHTEAPGSHTFEMQDIPLLADIAHSKNAIVSMDNTWATPLYFRPLDFGVDLSLNAATKYPSGHSDILMGTASANERYFEQLYDNYTWMGLCAAPDDAYQILRGLRTMGVRLAHHYQSALEVAHWLEQQPEVSRVLHPALESFPGHAIWKRDFAGASGLFSIVLKAAEGEFRAKQHAFIDALEIFGIGYSWGGYESLAVPSSLASRTVCKGPDDGPVIRLHIGLENVEDLIGDLEKGLAAVRKS
ncbi:cystathionine beta-lyase [Martelella mediterranea]|uniref:Cystathionine beta-lyase n=1 Tax=Martelella mediterranea TaxID=293089 RepID=A0A4R3NZA6_9HYPH|nr:cystathionine beta-lyase [Martelella mediterranea]TCT40930.1 cystathionine beta-lyase [Martelella mediterranea]